MNEKVPLTPVPGSSVIALSVSPDGTVMVK